jgi:hypothetical protein
VGLSGTGACVRLPDLSRLYWHIARLMKVVVTHSSRDPCPISVLAGHFSAEVKSMLLPDA